MDSGFISPKKDSEGEEATAFEGGESVIVNHTSIGRVDDLLKMLNKV